MKHVWFLGVVLLLLASFGGCVGYSEGIEVALWVRPSPEGPLLDVELGDGSAMRVDGLMLSIESAELVRCGESGGHHHHASRARELLRDLLLPARAAAQHQHGSPLVLNGPFLVDLTHPEAVALPELFQPAPGCYDRVMLSLSELSLGAHHAGTYVSSRSSSVITANAPLEAPLEIPHEINDLTHPSLEVTLARARPFALLDRMPGELEGDRVLAGIAAQTEARTLD